MEPEEPAGDRKRRATEVRVEDVRRDDEAVDVAVEDSFPASDPPSSTATTTGAPVRAPAGVPDADRHGPSEDEEREGGPPR
jgi:hypothetical protein